MTTMCCPRCFGDSFLEDKIHREASAIGVCDYCSSKNVPLVEPSLLRDDFETVIGVYHEQAELGRSLIDCLKEDWGLFTDIPDQSLRSLLCDICDDPSLNQRNYVPSLVGKDDKVRQWDLFREELKHRNRFFPTENIDLEELRRLFAQLPRVNAPEFMYRARIQESEMAFTLDQMGMPPRHACRNGRANPIGIPYLYLASDADTAIAEVRPHPGDHLSIASFRSTEEKILLDLCSPRTSFPFGEEQDVVKRAQTDLRFLSRLGEELSSPILPRVAQLEYLPSQYLCEFIKNEGSQGVIYRSAVGPGKNYAFFDDSGLQAVDCWTVDVTKVEIFFAKN